MWEIITYDFPKSSIEIKWLCKSFGRTKEVLNLIRTNKAQQKLKLHNKPKSTLYFTSLKQTIL